LSQSIAFFLAAQIHGIRGEEAEAHESARALLELANEKGFEMWYPVASLYLGSILVRRGQVRSGIAQMRAAVVEIAAAQNIIGHTYNLALMAEAYGSAGQTDNALRILEEALAMAGRTGERLWEAELRRLKGENLLKSSSTNEAATCFQEALTVAREQEAKSFELRASMSLARLLHHQGNRGEARTMLVEIYNWFTEGFDTADLKDAKVLLTQLGN
jgi:predicted ATPase